MFSFPKRQNPSDSVGVKLLLFGAIQDLNRIGELLDLWSDSGADGVAFTVPFDMLDERFFDNTKTARNRGLRVLVHPMGFGYNTKSMYTPSDPSTHGYMLEKIGFTIDRIRSHDLEPLVILHPPRLSAPDVMVAGEKMLDEEKAFKSSIPFLDKLSRMGSQSSISIAIECMHDPNANPGHALLGYTVEQLEEICNERDFGICVDTGHAKLSRTSVSDYLNSSLNILTIHLQGNDGSYDQHELPTMKNVGDVRGVLKLLSLNIPITVEANSYKLLEEAEKSRETTIEKLSSTFEYIRKRTLPPG